jgi:hypothetical protein
VRRQNLIQIAREKDVLNCISFKLDQVKTISVEVLAEVNELRRAAMMQIEWSFFRTTGSLVDGNGLLASSNECIEQLKFTI